MAGRPRELTCSITAVSGKKKVVGSELVGPDDGVGCHHGPVDMRS